jgi:hypothetical protein
VDADEPRLLSDRLTTGVDRGRPTSQSGLTGVDESVGRGVVRVRTVTFGSEFGLVSPWLRACFGPGRRLDDIAFAL